jgi:hypothetical protein
MRSLPWLLLTTLVVAGQAVRQEVSHAPVKGTSFPKIQLNDNHRPAGHQHDHVRGLRPWISMSSTISVKKTYIRAIISSARCPLGHAAGGCEYLADGDENGKRDCESEA